jgi:SAM-dependent methyltransferase
MRPGDPIGMPKLRAPRGLLKLLGYLRAHTVFQLRQADEYGEIYRPHGVAVLTTALNQALIERGVRPPWVWSARRCEEFWATLKCGDENPNAPAAVKPTEIVDFLHDFWSPDVVPDDAVLEIGCNAGANLARLRQLGYTRLSGVDINQHAIEELRRVFPELADTSTLYQGRVEDVLPTLASESADVVFAMSVLHHIHPTSRNVFPEMVRIARHYVCSIEPEQRVSDYVFCRNYRRVFETLGCRQVRAVEIGRSTLPDLDEYYGFTVRLFSVPTR